MNNLIKFDPLMVLACLEIVQQYCNQHDTCKGCLFHNKGRGCGFAEHDQSTQPHEWDIESFHKNLMREARKEFKTEEE